MKKCFFIFAFVFCKLTMADIVVNGLDAPIPETQTVNGKKLVFNGVGPRTVSFLGLTFTVYYAAVYLEKKSSNDKEILSSKGIKKITQYFRHDVSRKQAVEHWEESFQKNCPPDCKELRARFDDYLAQVHGVKKGEVVSFLFLGNKMQVVPEGLPVVEIQGHDFETFLLSTWFGPNVPNPELKSGMLGLSSAK